MTIHTLEIFFKLILACLLSGIIGFERESINRPAGFRTHILVGIGATIVMITNIELVNIMPVDVQPGRFGAAVISGIGFLGAGTIIKEGSTVKGLTTAASLWATACIGLALGSGLYTVAIPSTGIVFFTLIFFPKFERKMSQYRNISSIRIVASNDIGQLSKITTQLSEMEITIYGIKTIEHKDENLITLIMDTKSPGSITENKIIEGLIAIKGIESIEVDPT